MIVEIHHWTVSRAIHHSASCLLVVGGTQFSLRTFSLFHLRCASLGFLNLPEQDMSGLIGRTEVCLLLRIVISVFSGVFRDVLQ